MDIEIVIKSIVGLIVVLGILMFVLLYKPKEKKKKVSRPKQAVPIQKKEKIGGIDLETLRNIIKNKNSTTKELEDAVNRVLKNYGNITNKMGIRLHPDFDIYNEMLFMLSKHKNANKDIILKFNRGLEKRNPQYKSEINDAVTRGLNARV